MITEHIKEAISMVRSNLKSPFLPIIVDDLLKTLNEEIDRRDQRIAELEAQLAERHQTP